MGKPPVIVAAPPVPRLRCQGCAHELVEHPRKARPGWKIVTPLWSCDRCAPRCTCMAQLVIDHSVSSYTWICSACRSYKQFVTKPIEVLS